MKSKTLSILIITVWSIMISAALAASIWIVAHLILTHHYVLGMLALYIGIGAILGMVAILIIAFVIVLICSE